LGGEVQHGAIGGLSPYSSSKTGGPTPKLNFWGFFSEILGFSNFDFWILELAKLKVILTLRVCRTSRVLLKTKKNRGSSSSKF